MRKRPGVTYRRMALVAAAVAGFVLARWSMDHGRPAVRVEALTEARVEPARLRGASTAKPYTPLHPGLPPPLHRSIRVIVLDEATRAPVSEAGVGLFATEAESTLFGAPPVRDLVAHGTTDAVGVATFKLDPRLQACLCVVDAPDHLVASRTVPERISDLTIAVQPGLEIRGVVLGPGDVALAHIDVEVRSVGVPRLPLRLGSSIHRRVVRSGQDGRFEGIVPPGTYILSPFSDGYAIRSNARPSFPDRTTGVMAIAGTHDVVLRIVPVRFFRFCLVDDLTSQPLDARPTTLNALIAGRALPIVRSFFPAGGTWMQALVAVYQDGHHVFTGGVCEDAFPSDVPLQVRVVVELPGYRLAAAPLTLRRTPLPEDGNVDIVRLAPKADAPPCTLRVRYQGRTVEGIGPPWTPDLSVEMEPGFYASWMGVFVKENVIEYRNVPSGPRRLAIVDHLSVPRVFEAELPPGAHVDLHPPLGEVTGLVVDLRNVEGNALFDAVVLTESSNARGQRLRTLPPSLTAWREDGLRSCVPLSPGRRTIYVRKTGYQPTQSTVDMPERGVVVARITLTPVH